MVLTRSEKEELVKQLYEEGKTYREIAKEAHMSFGPIGNIIRKVTGDNSKSSSNKPIVSRETKALRLFSDGNAPIEVAIKLDISIEMVEELYLGFWRLKQQPFLAFVYKELGSHFSSFLRLFKLLRDAKIAEEEAVTLINEAKQIPFLRNTYLDLTNANANLEGQRKNMLSELSNVRNEIDRQQGYLRWDIAEQKRVNFEIEQRKRELQHLDRLIDDKMKEYLHYK
jgi:DNA-binding CsgD family transcriptional regulator